MIKDPLVFLNHILESIILIEEYTKGMAKGSFIHSRKTRDAVIHNIEIIGEAAKNVPVSFRQQHPELPWAEMAKTRDKLIHGYFEIDLGITWGVITTDLPILKEKVKELLKTR